MKQDKRLERIEDCLTPKQAALVWLKETNSYANIVDYVKSVRDLPQPQRPVPRLTGQVGDATREVMKGQPKGVIEAAVHRAQRDVCFLIKLHNQVNYYFMTEERVWSVIFAALEGQLRAITREGYHRYLTNNLCSMFSRDIPYPLESETAATVRAAICNHVTTWEELKENIFDGWLYNCLLDQGARELPEGAYEYDDGGEYKPRVNTDNEKEVRACFKDDAEFERFKAGEDYSKGLATVTDAEYDAHYERMVTAVRELVDSDQVQGGASVFLETVPVPFLQDTPLVEGCWIDHRVVELAELGALLAARGYQAQEALDDHPLAWARFTNSSGSEVDRDAMRRLRQLIARRLKKLPGRTKKIGGRLYISFADYCCWRGRKVKGDLLTSMCPGFTAVSWNKWLDAKCSKGRLAGITIDRLHCYVGEHDYLVCPDGAEVRLDRRASLLGIMSKAGSSQARHEDVVWKDIAGPLLSKLYAFRQASATISQRYFDGEEVLFSDLVRSLAELIKYTEELVVMFNDEVAGAPEEKMDLESFRHGAGTAATERISYLVDMAKAEALDAMGEDRAATEMVERYLEV